MEFKTVLTKVIVDFGKEDIHYALIGGFAMGVLGVVRATVDLDFLVLKEDLPKLDQIMKKHDYKCVHRTENVSQFVSSSSIFGEIDYLHAFRPITCKMLERSLLRGVFEEKLKIKVLRPEDIMGLKVQAMANDERRAGQECMDIETLAGHCGRKLDWTLLEEYFSMFNFQTKFEELKKKYGEIDS